MSPNSKLWPSEILLPISDAIALSAQGTLPSPSRRHGVFNAGVMGDNIMNVIYRLQGSGAERIYQNPKVPNILKTPELEGLFSALLAKENIKLWVVHIGANDILPNHQWDPLPLYVLLELLFRNSNDKAKVLLTGLFYAANVPSEYIDRLNLQYMRTVEYFSSRYGAERIQFLLAPREFDRKIHLDQGPHLEGLYSQDLNADGYRVWIKQLVPKMWQMVGLDNSPGPGGSGASSSGPGAPPGHGGSGPSSSGPVALPDRGGSGASSSQH